MSAVVAGTSYRRAPGTLWRDTGVHVLALPPGGEHDVVVLGGGGALLWRLLDRPLDVPGLRDSLVELGESSPEVAEIVACLDELLLRGLLTQLTPDEEPR